MKLNFSSLAVSAAAVLMLAGCAKKTDCIAKIICRDAAGNPKSGVDVHLFANVRDGNSGIVTADLKADGFTDNQGQVSFTFKLPAIYDIKAVSSGTLVNTDIITLEEGKITEKTVTIQ
ncbi:MAG: hypothetical protein ACXVPQ_13205 [Bacteroidia bacterium]